MSTIVKVSQDTSFFHNMARSPGVSSVKTSKPKHPAIFQAISSVVLLFFRRGMPGAGIYTRQGLERMYSNVALTISSERDNLLFFA